MQKTIYYIIYNHERGGYLHSNGVKTMWNSDFMKADKFFSEDEAKETMRWFPKNEVELKIVEVVIK